MGGGLVLGRGFDIRQVVKPAEVVLLSFPFSEHETVTFKKRPVLVLANTGHSVDSALWVMMITGNKRRFDRPSASDVRLETWETIGLAAPSVLRASRVWTAQERDVLQTIGACPPEILQRARALVVSALTDTK